MQPTVMQSMSIISAGTADANRCGTLSLGRHRNSTVGATPTIVQDNDSGRLFLLVVMAMICDLELARFAEVDGTPGHNDMPGACIFDDT